MLMRVTDRLRTLVAPRGGQSVRRLVPGRAWRRMRFLIVALVVVLVGAGCTPLLQDVGAVGEPSVPSLGHEGRWFTDATGRVVMLRGMNFVEKWAPFTPAADGFNDDDAALLASNGFNALRLGVPFEFVMPAPGQVDRGYLESIAETVRILGRHHIYVLLDFHQDGWGPVTHGNGMPAWATLTDGLPNPPDPFPTYYVTNPALQRAFDNFWANRPGPDGVPLQDYYARGMAAVAELFASSSNVIGYEAMNEPWPGASWSSCLSGCPDLEAQSLAPFYARMTAAVRAVDRRHPVFVEPFVLFNFGGADTSLPGTGSTNVLSTHVYALGPAANASAVDRSVAAAERDAAALLVTEWGATSDPATLTQTEDQFDARLVPWLYWSYNGLVVADSKQPLVSPNLNVTVLNALTRPYPTLVNGTPTGLSFDAATATLDFEFSTRRPDGRRAPRGLETVVNVPARSYPTGYAVTVVGADVTSRRCAPTLTLRNQPRATTVSVRVTPAGCP
ncbi:MAG: endoglycosylceramidase [Actinomycetota bacterium]|nr:endoglycosylceramidase [Actinomycetota bacterium]